jgi:glycosyltransferase involved in cell wall biosynthesis
MMMSISVIVPTYNSSKTIERALQSVFNQSRPADEIIVIDDGSSDCTIDILNKYKEKIVVVAQTNSGAAAARNRAVERSSGDLIAFLDSDDMWHPQKLEIQAAVFENDASVGISSTGFYTIAEHEIVREENASPVDKTDIAIRAPQFNKIFLSPFLATPTVMLKRDIFLSKNGFDESLTTAEDVDLWLRFCFTEKYILIKNQLCWVFAQANSLTSRATYSPFLAHLDVINSFCQNNKSFALENQNLINTSKSLIYTCIGSSLICKHEKFAARQQLLTAIKLKPTFRSIYLFIKTFI